MSKMRALGTSLTYAPAYNSADIDTKAIGSLTSVGEISPDSEELDATCLDSSGGYREFLQGFKDSGELTLSGYLDPDKPGQTQMVTLYGSGALGYFWVTFPDQTTVAFNAYVKSFTVGSAEVDGIVGFGATLRVSGLIQVISTKYINTDDVLDATAYAVTGTPAYQWYSNDAENYESPSIIAGATAATYDTTGALGYYFCKVTVPNYRPVNSQIFTVV
jgi:predicted secreted protein